MLSNASKYAIRAVLFLAEEGRESKKFGSKQIADDLDIPLAFIAKILQQLVKANIISSSKGPGGGFYLSSHNRQKHVADILGVIEKDNILSSCMMGLPTCGDNRPCPIHHIVAPFKLKLIKKFEGQTIHQLAEEVTSQGLYLTLKGV